MKVTDLGGLTCRLVGGADGAGAGDGPLVILLHGFGAAGDDLVPVAAELGLPAAVRYLFPEAPVRLPGYGDGRAWWLIDLAGLEDAYRRAAWDELATRIPDGLHAARDRLVAWLEVVARELAPPGGPWLGGFSQGAMLACATAFGGTTPLAGLVLWSGSLIDRAAWRLGMATRRGLPVVQSHGRGDPLLPFALAERLRDELGAAGLEVHFTAFSGGHEIPRAVLRATREVVATVIERTASRR